MAKFSEIKTKGMVSVTEITIENDNKEYKFEYTVFDSGTGEQLTEKRVEIIQEEMLINEKTMLENRRDEDVVRYNNEIIEITDKLAAITEIKL